jgi:transcriptional regulator with XRE-family HTH domain
MTGERRARVDAIKQRMLQEMQLYQLREQAKVSQVELARRMKTAQGAISRLERQPDMLVSTLREYVQAMGGQLQISAKVNGRVIALRRLGRGRARRRKRRDRR